MDFSNFDLRPLLLGYPMLLLALSFHECAHAWASDRYGDPTARYLGRITLNPIAHIDIFGTVLFPIIAFLTGVPLLGWAKPVPVNPRHLQRPARDNVFISLAGPFSNLLLGLFLYFCIWLLLATGLFEFSLQSSRFEQGMRTLLEMLKYGFFINIILMIFNLIPVPPLDGSHVLEYFLPYQARDYWEKIKPYSFFILLALFYAGLLNLVIRPVVLLLNFMLTALV